MTIRAKSAFLLAIALFAIAIAACGGGGAATSSTPSPAALRDPAERGPYVVGLTKMTFERPSTIDGSPRSLETWIWYPSAATNPADGAAITDAAPESQGGPFPVVIFSHGSGGQPNFYTYFTEHLASWGFVVVAPPHPGNTSADCSSCTGASIITSARERPGDIDLVLDRVAAIHADTSQPLGRIIDPSRIAIAGHSFGGWTAVFTATDPRFSAVVAMAPALPETLIARASGITAPILLLSGAKDEIVPPESVAKLGAALPPATTTYVSFPEGRHNTFLDRCLGCGAGALAEQRGHDLVNRYATAFLETYVIKDARYAHYLAEDVAPDALIVHDAAAGGQ
jgi:predicted dienelactone hydrolase